MILSMIENLERILIETNDVKENLRQICEKSWDLLSPPGSHSNGFRIIKTTPNEKSISSESGNKVAAVDRAIEDITDLIAYGQTLRRTSLDENKKVLKSTRNDFRGLSQKVDKSKCNIKPKNTKCATEAKTANKSENSIHNKRSIKTKAVIKSLPSQTNETSTSSNAESHTKADTFKALSIHKSTDDNETLSRNMMADHPEGSSSSSPVLYSHTCSLPLTDTIKSLKMPEALKHVLKQHYYYEHKKMKPNVKEDMYSFKESFEKLINLRLQNHLKTNFVQADRYVKYLDIANTDCKKHKKYNKTSGKWYSPIHYGSEVQLCSLEGRYHRLMELHLQRRLLTTVTSLIQSTVKN